MVKNQTDSCENSISAIRRDAEFGCIVYSCGPGSYLSGLIYATGRLVLRGLALRAGVFAADLPDDSL